MKHFLAPIPSVRQPLFETSEILPPLNLVDVSDIFNFFFCFGGGEREEESEAKRVGGYFYLKIERGKGVSEEGRRGGAHLRWEGVAGRGGGGG